MYKKLFMLFTVILMVMAYCIAAGAESAKPTSAKPTSTAKTSDPKDSLAVLISGVFQKIAGVIIFIGAIQVAWAIKSESPDAKSQGLKTIAAGVLVVAVATGYTVFTK